MRAKKIKWMAAIITMGLTMACLPVFAQTEAPVDQQAPADQQTEASTGVARVSLIRGNVSMERGDSGEWVAVTVNTPLVPGDTLATAAGAHAEVQLDYSNVVRLDQNTEVKIADLTGSRIQLQVAHGTADLAVFKGNQANAEVDTPNVAVQPMREGTYRVDVNSNELSLITVNQGEAQVSTPQGSTNVEEGQQITVEGAQNPQYQVANARPMDDWDNWNRDRNSAIANTQNYSHVNQYYTGAQDLNSNGRWNYVPGYDWCWTPYVDAGWVPYSNGRWVWEPYYGWTWVSYDSWGWAPYHYGRWFYYGSSWCWWPGDVTPFYRPLWAPAYVSFFGFGYGYHRFSFGYGYGFNSIGWCPLGPRDRFDRWWGRGRDRDHGFNRENFGNYYGREGFQRGRGGYGGSNLRAAFNNASVRRGIVTMSSDRFGRDAVRGNHQVVSQAMLRQADVVHGTLPVVPTRASLRTTNRAAVVPAVARGRANNTRFFSRNTAATSNRGNSFNNQAASIRQMVQSRNNVSAPGANRGNAGANGGFQSSRPAAAQGNARAAQQRGNAGRQSPAPVVRQAPQAGRNASPGNGRNVQPNRSNFRSFGTGAPAPQSRGNVGRQNSAPVVRQNNQTRQPNAAPRSGQPQSNRSNFRSFGTGAPAPQSRGNVGRQNSAPVVRQNNQTRQPNAAPRSGQPQSNRSNFRSFGTGAPAPQSRGNVGRQNSAPVVRQNNQMRQQNAAPRSAQPQSNRSNWRSFSGSAPGSSGAAVNRGGQRFSAAGNSQQNTGNNFRRFTPQSAPQRGGGSFYNGGSRSQGFSQPRNQRQSNYGSYSRPPLQLNKPIVTPRRYQSSGGSRGGSMPSYNRGYSRGPSPSYNRGYSGGSAPSYNRGYSGGSAPSYRGNPGGGYRGSYSAPSRSSGGGGNRGSYSAPSRSSGGGGGYHGSSSGSSHGGGGRHGR